MENVSFSTVNCTPPPKLSGEGFPWPHKGLTWPLQALPAENGSTSGFKGLYWCFSVRINLEAAQFEQSCFLKDKQT